MIISCIVVTIAVVVGVLWAGHNDACPHFCSEFMHEDEKKRRKKAIIIGTPIVIAVTLIAFWGGGMLVQKLLGGQYRDEISKAEQDRMHVREFLVESSPELSGVAPEEVVFSTDGIRMTVTAPVSFTVKDATSYAMLKSYYEKWEDFDAASVIRSKEKIAVTVIALVVTVAAGLIMSFLANPYSRIYHYKEEIPDYIGEFRKQLGLDK